MPTFYFLGPSTRVTRASDDRLERIRDIANRVAAGNGLTVFDVQLRRESIGLVLRVIIDRQVPYGEALPQLPVTHDESVSVADCQRVSQDISAILDVEDPFGGRYTLEVSSPGLDRPLRCAEDYRRFAGRLAKVVTGEPIDGQKYLAGRLRGLEDDSVVIETTNGRVFRIPLAAIKRARLDVEF